MEGKLGGRYVNSSKQEMEISEKILQMYLDNNFVDGVGLAFKEALENKWWGWRLLSQAYDSGVKKNLELRNFFDIKYVESLEKEYACDDHAMYMLSELYLWGHNDIQPDQKRGSELLKALASKGYSPAEVSLGDYHLSGVFSKVIKKDLAEAKRLFVSAANKNEEVAKNYLLDWDLYERREK